MVAPLHPSKSIKPHSQQINAVQWNHNSQTDKRQRQRLAHTASDRQATDERINRLALTSFLRHML